MTVSLQRVLAIIIIFNTLIVLVNGFVYNVSSNERESEFGSILSNADELSNSYENNLPLVNPDSQQTKLDRSTGNVEFGQGFFGSILLGGISKSYLGCAVQECDTEYARWFTNGVTLFLWIVNILLGLEVLYLWYSKKYT